MIIIANSAFNPMCSDEESQLYVLSFFLLQGFHNFSCNKSFQYHIMKVMALIGLNKTTLARKCMHVQ